MYVPRAVWRIRKIIDGWRNRKNPRHQRFGNIALRRRQGHPSACATNGKAMIVAEWQESDFPEHSAAESVLNLTTKMEGGNVDIAVPLEVMRATDNDSVRYYGINEANSSDSVDLVAVTKGGGIARQTFPVEQRLPNFDSVIESHDNRNPYRLFLDPSLLRDVLDSMSDCDHVVIQPNPDTPNDKAVKIIGVNSKSKVKFTAFIMPITLD